MIYLRGKVWWIKIKWKGKVVRRSTGETARRKAENLERQLLKKLGEAPEPDEAPLEEPVAEQDTLFRDVWERYLVEELPLKSVGTQERAEQCARKFLPEIGELALSSVSPSVLNAYKVKRLKDGVSMATVAKELKFIQRVFTLCIREWELIGKSPFDKFRVPTVNNELTRFLKPGQLEKLVAAAPVWLRPIILIAQMTGIRRGNLATLKWAQIDLEGKTLALPKTKNGDPLLIPLIDEACELFEALRETGKKSEHVFLKDGRPLKPSQITQAFMRTRDKLGLEFRYHDLRHDFATNLVKKGVELYRVGKLLAQRNVNMTKRYAHLDIDDLRDAVSVLSSGSGYKALPVLASQEAQPAEPGAARV